MTKSELINELSNFDDDTEILIGSVVDGEKFVEIDFIEGGIYDYVKGTFKPSGEAHDTNAVIWSKE